MTFRYVYVVVPLQVKADLITHLKPLAISRLEFEVVEISVVSSWLLQTDLFLQSMLRRRRINPTSTALNVRHSDIVSDYKYCIVFY